MCLTVEALGMWKKAFSILLCTGALSEDKKEILLEASDMTGL